MQQQEQEIQQLLASLQHTQSPAAVQTLRKRIRDYRGVYKHKFTDDLNLVLNRDNQALAQAQAREQAQARQTQVQVQIQEEREDEYIAHEQTPLLLQESHQNQESDERHQDIIQITNDVSAINEIFRDIGHLVNEQGYMLENIERNVDDTLVNVQGAQGELVTAGNHLRSSSKWLCWIAIFLAIILLVTVLFMMKPLKSG